MEMKYLKIVILFTLCTVVFFMCQDTKQNSPEDQARMEAAKLYENALQLEARKDYVGARTCYEKSLDLYEDETVQAAYLRLLATIGPM